MKGEAFQLINGILIVLLILICIFAVKGSAKRMIYGCCGGRDVEKKKKVADRDPSHYPYCAQIRIEGMSCNHCRIRVENSFNELNGVWAEVSLKEKQALAFRQLRQLLCLRIGHRKGLLHDQMLSRLQRLLREAVMQAVWQRQIGKRR